MILLIPFISGLIIFVDFDVEVNAKAKLDGKFVDMFSCKIDSCVNYKILSNCNYIQLMTGSLTLNTILSLSVAY